MRVQSNVNNSVQTTQQTDSAKKSESVKNKSAELKQKAAYGDVSGSVKSDISAKSKEYGKAHAVASETPDVRENKIEEIKRRIAEGKYKVDPDKVAEKLVNEHMSF